MKNTPVIDVRGVKVVEIDLSKVVPAYRPRYAILIDRLPDEINAFARANPEVFVFTFLFSMPKVDYHAMDKSNYIVKPMYVGNFGGDYPQHELCSRIAAQLLGCDLSEMDEVPTD